MPRDVAECVSMSGKEDHIGSVPLWGWGNREGCHVLAIEVNLESKKNVLAIKTNPAAKERVLVLSQSWPVWSTVWQCGSVAVWSTHTMKSWPHNIDTTDLFLSKLGTNWNIWSFIHHGVTSFNHGKLCICVFVFVFVYVYVYSNLPSLPCFNARKKV